jgi:hypothetical protein
MIRLLSVVASALQDTEDSPAMITLVVEVDIPEVSFGYS